MVEYRRWIRYPSLYAKVAGSIPATPTKNKQSESLCEHITPNENERGDCMKGRGSVGHIEFERCSDATVALSMAGELGIEASKKKSTITIQSGGGAHLVPDLIGSLRRGFDIEARHISEGLIV